MKTRIALVVLVLARATPSAADIAPEVCERILSAKRPFPTLVRQCADALGGAPDPRQRERAPLQERRTSAEWTAAARRIAVAPLATDGAATEPSLEPQPEPGPACALDGPGHASIPASACLECHPRHGHTVGLDYAASYARAGWILRAPAEVVRRGVLLPEGRMECVTCHDGNSPWKWKIALPPGAPALAAVVPGQESTYGGRNWRLATATSVPPLPAGSAVSAAPLCAACHTMAD